MFVISYSLDTSAHFFLFDLALSVNQILFCPGGFLQTFRPSNWLRNSLKKKSGREKNEKAQGRTDVHLKMTGWQCENICRWADTCPRVHWHVKSINPGVRAVHPGSRIQVALSPVLPGKSVWSKAAYGRRKCGDSREGVNFRTSQLEKVRGLIGCCGSLVHDGSARVRNSSRWCVSVCPWTDLEAIRFYRSQLYRSHKATPIFKFTRWVWPKNIPVPVHSKNLSTLTHLLFWADILISVFEKKSCSTMLVLQNSSLHLSTTELQWS